MKGEGCENISTNNVEHGLKVELTIQWFVVIREGYDYASCL